MLIEYYVCGCGYEVTRDDVDIEAVVLKSHMVDEVHTMNCSECNQLYSKEVQVKRFMCPQCGEDLALIKRSDGVDDEVGNSESGGVPQVMGTGYCTPIHSDALAIMPDQVEEHRKLFPKIELDSECRPVFTNAKDHQEYMDKVGVVKRTQKIKSRGKIYSIPGGQCS